MNRETLVCTCGREVGLVRLNAETVAFGHRSNPGLASHPVRLARSSSDRSLVAPAMARAGEPDQATTEGPATRREDAATAGPSTPKERTARGPRSDGSTRSRISPSGISMKLRAEPLQSGHPSSLTPAPLGASRRSAARSG